MTMLFTGASSCILPAMSARNISGYGVFSAGAKDVLLSLKSWTGPLSIVSGVEAAFLYTVLITNTCGSPGWLHDRSTEYIDPSNIQILPLHSLQGSGPS